MQEHNELHQGGLPNEGTRGTRRGTRPLGCLALILAPYVIHAGFILTPNVYNRLRWGQRGSDTYRIVVSNTSMRAGAGTSVLEVREGILRSVQHPACQACTEPEWDEWIRGPAGEEWNRETIAGLFGAAVPCAIYFPLLTCSIEYNPQLGSPQLVEVNFPIPDACYSRWSVLELNLR